MNGRCPLILLAILCLAIVWSGQPASALEGRSFVEEATDAQRIYFAGQQVLSEELRALRLSSPELFNPTTGALKRNMPAARQAIERINNRMERARAAKRREIAVELENLGDTALARSRTELKSDLDRIVREAGAGLPPEARGNPDHPAYKKMEAELEEKLEQRFQSSGDADTRLKELEKIRNAAGLSSADFIDTGSAPSSAFSDIDNLPRVGVEQIATHWEEEASRLEAIREKEAARIEAYREELKNSGRTLPNVRDEVTELRERAALVRKLQKDGRLTDKMIRDGHHLVDAKTVRTVSRKIVMKEVESARKLGYKVTTQADRATIVDLDSVTWPDKPLEQVGSSAADAQVAKSAGRLSDEFSTKGGLWKTSGGAIGVQDPMGEVLANANKLSDALGADDKAFDVAAKSVRKAREAGGDLITPDPEFDRQLDCVRKRKPAAFCLGLVGVDADTYAQGLDAFEKKLKSGMGEAFKSAKRKSRDLDLAREDTYRKALQSGNNALAEKALKERIITRQDNAASLAETASRDPNLIAEITGRGGGPYTFELDKNGLPSTIVDADGNKIPADAFGDKVARGERMHIDRSPERGIATGTAKAAPGKSPGSRLADGGMMLLDGALSAYAGAEWAVGSEQTGDSDLLTWAKATGYGALDLYGVIPTWEATGEIVRSSLDKFNKANPDLENEAFAYARMMAYLAESTGELTVDMAKGLWQAVTEAGPAALGAWSVGVDFDKLADQEALIEARVLQHRSQLNRAAIAKLKAGEQLTAIELRALGRALEAAKPKASGSGPIRVTSHMDRYDGEPPFHALSNGDIIAFKARVDLPGSAQAPRPVKLVWQLLDPRGQPIPGITKEENLQAAKGGWHEARFRLQLADLPTGDYRVVLTAPSNDKDKIRQGDAAFAVFDAARITDFRVSPDTSGQSNVDRIEPGKPAYLFAYYDLANGERTVDITFRVRDGSRVAWETTFPREGKGNLAAQRVGVEVPAGDLPAQADLVAEVTIRGEDGSEEYRRRSFSTGAPVLGAAVPPVLAPGKAETFPITPPGGFKAPFSLTHGTDDRLLKVAFRPSRLEGWISAKPAAANRDVALSITLTDIDGRSVTWRGKVAVRAGDGAASTAKASADADRSGSGRQTGSRTPDLSNPIAPGAAQRDLQELEAIGAQAREAFTRKKVAEYFPDCMGNVRLDTEKLGGQSTHNLGWGYATEYDPKALYDIHLNTEKHLVRYFTDFLAQGTVPDSPCARRMISNLAPAYQALGMGDGRALANRMTASLGPANAPASPPAATRPGSSSKPASGPRISYIVQCSSIRDQGGVGKSGGAEPGICPAGSPRMTTVIAGSPEEAMRAAESQKHGHVKSCTRAIPAEGFKNYLDAMKRAGMSDCPTQSMQDFMATRK